MVMAYGCLSSPFLVCFVDRAKTRTVEDLDRKLAAEEPKREQCAGKQKPLILLERCKISVGKTNLVWFPRPNNNILTTWAGASSLRHLLCYRFCKSLHAIAGLLLDDDIGLRP